MHTNLFRKLLQENRPSMGTRILSTWPLMVEAVGASGQYDYIEFVAEYAPFTDADLENLVRAAELHKISSMIKVDFQNRFYIAQRALAAGFQSILFTDLKSAEEVRQSIEAIRADCPQDKGRFGKPTRRFIGFEPNLPQMEYAAMLRETVVAIMIEKRQAFEELQAICSIDGVDMVQFGPSDYAMNSGWDFAEHKQEVRDVEKRMIEIALEKGVEPRCEINHSEEAKPYIALGVKHFCLGDELRNNMIYWSTEGKALRSVMQAK
ncbi:MAG: aldolase/citrate lyase family protein [Sphaerochaeta sp.]|nr:aldolase/citrate lyase family protein [Sphaerochaeta sp.]